MDLISRDQLQALTGDGNAGPVVSIYRPTYRVGADMQQNPIRLKNLLAQAEGKLTNAGLRAPEAREFLEPVQGVLNDGMFWQKQSDGLALEDLLDLAAVQTFLNNGRVYAVEPEQVPGGEPVAAIFRY